MPDLPFGNYRPFDQSLSVGSCNCAYSGPYNEECEFYHKEYHMGGYVSTCLNQDVFGWCECSRCSKNARRADGDYRMTDPKCKWEQDEVCVNADCPLCADFCPVVYTPGVCRWEEREAQKPCEACSLVWRYNERETAGRLLALQDEGRGTDPSLRSE